MTGDIMKISIVDDDGRRFTIPVPVWIVKIGLNNFVKKKIVEHAGSDAKYIEGIDFDAIAQSFDELKNYKGMDIVDIKSKDGTSVKITV